MCTGVLNASRFPTFSTKDNPWLLKTVNWNLKQKSNKVHLFSISKERNLLYQDMNSCLDDALSFFPQ